MERNAARVDDVEQRVELVADEVFRVLDAPGRHPVGRELGRVLLEEALAVDAVRIARQHQRPIVQVRAQNRPDRLVVREQVALGVAVGRPEDLLQVAEPKTRSGETPELPISDCGRRIRVSGFCLPPVSRLLPPSLRSLPPFPARRIARSSCPRAVARTPAGAARRARHLRVAHLGDQIAARRRRRARGRSTPSKSKAGVSRRAALEMVEQLARRAIRRGRCRRCPRSAARRPRARRA